VSRPRLRARGLAGHSLLQYAPAMVVAAVLALSLVPALVSSHGNATGFTNLFRSTFGGVFRAQRAIERDYHQAPFFAHSVRYVRRMVEPVEAYLYRPTVAVTRRLSVAAGRLQSGHVSLYLLYLVAVFVLVLLVH